MPIQNDTQRAAAYSAAGVTPTAPATTLAPAPAYNAPSSISSASLAPQPSLNVTQSTVAPIPTVPVLPNGGVPVPAPTTDTAQPAASTFTTQLQQLQAQLSGQALDTAATKDAATAPYESQLNNINTQIAQQQATALSHQEAALRSGETTGFASREAQNVQRTDAIQMLSLQAVQAGIQGNIAQAEQHAQTAIDLKYGQMAKDIETAKSNIYNNYDSLSPAEKKTADATLLRLNANDAFVKNAKEDQSAIFAMATAAAKNFPNDPAAQYAVQKALQTSDLTTAFNLIGKYQTDPQAIQSVILDQQLKRAQIASANANTAKTKQDIANGKPATQAQLTEAGYAARIAQSGQIIDGLTSSITSANPITFGPAGLVPSFLQSSDRQQFEQAKRNFVNAVLRQESGAAISPTEFSSAEKQYFPAPGDSPATIQQKADNRALILRNFQNASGNAYQAPPASGGSIPKGTEGSTYGHPGYVSDGTQWVLKK